jgi:protein-S-isoprenylcysteine O-methyltransferase Ste14
MVAQFRRPPSDLAIGAIRARETLQCYHERVNARWVVAGYLILQGAGTAAWWGLLMLASGGIDWFKPRDWPAESLLGFWLSDAVLLILGSFATAAAVVQKRSWASTAIWSLAAVAWYPTLYCLGVSMLTGEAWIASGMMATMAGLTLAMATIHGTGRQQPAAIRVASMNGAVAVAWTLGQVAVFWATFLWVLPRGIVELETRMGWSNFTHPGQCFASVSLFLAASLLGLWSGVTMATAGHGTPLPTATAPKLVISGPYRFIRNPMALAGILQGLAVGWYLGSFAVLAYAIAGAFVWHVFVRPVEEADLRSRFGDAYERYRQRVQLWIPISGFDRDEIRVGR